MANSIFGYCYRCFTRPIIRVLIIAVVSTVLLFGYTTIQNGYQFNYEALLIENNPSRQYCHNNSIMSPTIRINFTADSNNITGFAYPIVPDIVHLIKFQQKEITFVEMINIMSIVEHHNPARILIHCNYCVNRTLSGKYWNMLGMKYRSVIEILEMEEPKTIFNKNLTYIEHASDVARIRILMKYGGIYLDNDVYVVRGLHGFRHYEMALGWDDDQFLGAQVLIAHKDARFLKYWLQSYHNYQGDQWYFNAGEYPTTSVLYKRPNIVHRVKLLFGVHMLVGELYDTYWPEWTNQYTIHLLINHRSYLDKDSPIKDFDENNVKTFNGTYGEMARLLMFGNRQIVP